MMKKIRFLFLLFTLSSANFLGQNNNDSLKKKANSLIYEQPDEAISIARQLLKSEKKTDEMAQLYILISNAYIAKKNNDSSLFYNLKAENLINKTTLPTTRIKILNSVAVQYQQMELYEKALESLDKSQEMTNQFSPRDINYRYNTGFINNMRGVIYRNQSNPDLAIEKFKLAAKNFSKLEVDQKSAANLSITYYNMGGCFMDLSQLPEAFRNYKIAENYAQKFQDNILMAYNLKGQGEIYFLMHRYEESLNVLYLAEKLAEPIGDLVLNEEIFTLLANNNLAINDIEKFQVYNARSLTIQKTLEEDELKSLNRYLNAQNLLHQETDEKVKRQFQIYDWIAIIAALGLFGFLLKKFVRIKKKNERQKKLIADLTQLKQVL